MLSLPTSDRSYYLKMRDGVEIALSLYFPNGVAPERPSTTLLNQTRYGRATMFRYPQYEKWRQSGYVVAVIDTRGSTSSFGPRRADIGPEQINDMEEVIAHLANRPWSNGKVIAVGASYMADTADIATSRAAPNLIGGVLRQLDFDTYRHLFISGGIFNDWMFKIWGDRTLALDLGRSPSPGTDLDCQARVEDCAKLFPLLQAVDEDQNYTKLRSALAGRDRWTAEDYEGADFRDDLNKKGFSIFASAPSAYTDDIIKQAKPVQIWGSWMDGGTADAALARYMSAPNVAQEVWITANNHSNTAFFDPYFSDHADSKAPIFDQFAEVARFFSLIEAGERPQRQINYYVLGTREMKRAKSWPPEGAQESTLYLSEDGALLTEASDEPAMTSYEVDFSAGSGENTRWSTQGGIDPAYADRREADKKLVVFDSAPMASTTELVGTPVIRLRVAAQTTDPAFFVYLADVAPDGYVTYLTEGMLRAIHRKPADPASLPYDQGPAPKSFNREDALPVTPGTYMNVDFSLLPVAAKIKQGHRLRISIAGADANYFRRHSEGKPERFDIATGGPDGSKLTIHTRPWTDE